jgi:hypothetical protein
VLKSILGSGGIMIFAEFCADRRTGPKFLIIFLRLSSVHVVTGPA